MFRILSEALKAQTVEAVGELRSLEVERLDNLQLAVWQKAIDGDVPSAIAVVRVIMARCRLLGLDGPSLLKTKDPLPTTLVVPLCPEAEARLSVLCCRRTTLLSAHNAAAMSSTDP